MSRGFEVLYLTDDVDEFALKMLGKYMDKEFKSVTAEALNLAGENEKQNAEKATKDERDMLEAMKEAIEKVSAVKFSANLTSHPVCLSSEGELSLEMEKVLRKMPGAEDAPKAQTVLEINNSHPIKEKLLGIYASDKEKLCKYAKLLYAEACLIGGIAIENPKEVAELITELM